MLTVDTTAAYLIKQRLISPQSVIDGELQITSMTRRNRNLRVSTRAEGSYLVKQPTNPDSPDAYTLRFEAQFYDFCQSQPALAEFQKLIPRMVFSDPSQALLTLEFFCEGASLWSYYQRFSADRFPSATAGAVGQALGVFHSAFRQPNLLSDPKLAFLPKHTPWILMVHRPGPEVLSMISPADYEILRILQSQPGLAAQLDTLRQLWQPQTAMHGDIKLDNILVLPTEADPPEGSGQVRLLDWELVQLGDPAWDVASAFHDFVVWWIVNLKVEGSIDDMVRSAPYPLAALQPSIRLLWQRYRETCGLSPSEAGQLLSRTVLFSAGRLIQSAYEYGQSAQRLPAPSVLMLQVASNILANPAYARTHLYGIAE